MSESAAGQRRGTLAWLGLAGGPLLAAAAYFGSAGWAAGEEPGSALQGMAAVAVLMAVWWLTEALPIAATAMIPLALFPLAGVMSAADTAKCYGDSNVFLFLGGFFVALGVEDCGLHRRLALGIVSAMGDSPGKVVLGFMLASWGLSMWLSNTATTMMMLPIAGSVLLESERLAPTGRNLRGFGVAVVLGIAYASSIGGIATYLGTPTNLIFRGEWASRFPDQPEVSFAGWMLAAGPLSALFLIIAWYVMCRWLFRVGHEPLLGGGSVIAEQRRALGPLRQAEIRMALLFAATALLWISREPVKGIGWAPALGLDYLADGKTRLVDDGTVAVFMAVLCFIVPSEGWGSRPLVTWESTVRIPWGVLLIFGGGFALAKGLEATHLDLYLGQTLGDRLVGLPPMGMVALTAFGMTFFTEITSNVASTQMVLPLLAETAVALKVDPLPLMLAATLSASFAFMLPVATPPNAIVYGSGRVTMAEMVRAGFVLNLIGVVLVTLAMWVLSLM